MHVPHITSAKGSGRNAGTREENKDEAFDVCLENKSSLNDKTLPMNKSAGGQGRPVSVSIKGDE